MTAPQPGIFALGTASHAYLELELAPDRNGRELVTALASLREPRTTMGGINLVAGFRPELWALAAPGHAPADLEGFNEEIVGVDDFTMPATQHDAVLWLSGSAYDVIFDTARAAIAALSGLASVAEETSSWPYRHDLDLTGFIDGTENPTLLEAPEIVLVPAGQPGEGGTVLLLQKWAHDGAAWESLPVAKQELVIGRRKADSEELDDKPADSHVASTDQDTFGKIFRRNMPYGTVTDHGTMFVGFCSDRRPLATMLESMSGLKSGKRDALTQYTRPVTGAFYFIPSSPALLAISPPDDWRLPVRQVELVLARRLEAAEVARRGMLAQILGAGVGKVVFLHLGRVVVGVRAKHPGDPASQAQSTRSVLESAISSFKKGDSPVLPSASEHKARLARIVGFIAVTALLVLVLSVAGAVAGDQAVPAPPANPTSADQIQNLDQVKTAIKGYYGDTITSQKDPVDGSQVLHTYSPTGAYVAEMAGLESTWSDTLDRAARHPAHGHQPTKPLAIVLDVDDTTLNTYMYEIYSNFVFNPTTNAAFVNAAIFPAVPGMPNLAAGATADGYTIFYITGRPESQRAGTVTNLTNAGYAPPDTAHLFLKDQGLPWLTSCTPTCTTTQYKTLTRQHIEDDLGFDIVGNFGDQFSDLTGGFADNAFKVPNPMYFLP